MTPAAGLFLVSEHLHTDGLSAMIPTGLVALSFLAPWALVSLTLPDPFRLVSLALVSLLLALLAAAGSWSWRAARAKGHDPARWAFLTIVTFGAGMVMLLATGAPRADTDGCVCLECGRVQALTEPFCFGCGASA